MHVRPFSPQDAQALAELFHRSVHQVARRHYSQDQVEAWSPAPMDPQRHLDRAASGRLFLVAVDDADAPLAYGDIEPNGHLDHFYAAPEAVGTGVAAALYRALEAGAVAWGLGRLFVEASETARPFFARQGFALVERNDFVHRGVAIHNYRMEKRL